MSKASEALKARTEAYAVAVVKFCDNLPNTMSGRRLGQQLLEAGTSIGANYRAACRAYTRPLFISKLATVAEEADESEFWLRIIRKTGLQSAAAIDALEQEAHELASIFTASLRTARGARHVRVSPANPSINNPSTFCQSANLPIRKIQRSPLLIPQRPHRIDASSALSRHEPCCERDDGQRNRRGGKDERISRVHPKQKAFRGTSQRQRRPQANQRSETRHRSHLSQHESPDV
jgi:four helix bundle protein